MHLLYLISTLSFVSLAAAWTTYVVPYSGGGDDTPALMKALSSNAKLSKNATILFKKGITYNILTPLKFPTFENVIVSIQGNISYGADVAGTQAIVASMDYQSYWFFFNGGTNVTLEGSQDSNWGWVDANGQKWWDSMQDLSKQVHRPMGWGFLAINGGVIRYMKLWQPIAWAFNTGSSNNIHVYDNKILAISSSGSTPYNTDGFDVGGTNQLFENNVVYNADDCISVGGKAQNITFRNGWCHGSWGLSIATSDVQNVLFENVVMEDCFHAARFGTSDGSNGHVSNVTWRDITLKNVILPIYLTQNYWDQDNGQDPGTSGSTWTTIAGFTFENFQGTIDDSNGNGISGSTGKEVVVFDLYKNTATSLLAKSITMKTLSGSPVTVICDPSVITNDVGFKCWDGLYEPTSAGK